MLKNKFITLFIIICGFCHPLSAEISKVYIDNDQYRAMPETVIRLDDSNFDEAILDGYVIVDFYATWCFPCKKFGPIFQKVAYDMGEVLTFAKVNVDEAPNSSRKNDVSSIPCIILYKDGKEIKRAVGSMDENKLRNFINSAL